MKYGSFLLLGFVLSIQKSGFGSDLTYCIQVSRLIQELAAAASAEKGLTFEEDMVERLCAYSRAVAHFPTAVKEVCMLSRWICVHQYISHLVFVDYCSLNGGMVGFTRSQRKRMQKGNLILVRSTPNG